MKVKVLHQQNPRERDFSIKQQQLTFSSAGSVCQRRLQCAATGEGWGEIAAPKAAPTLTLYERVG